MHVKDGSCTLASMHVRFWKCVHVYVGTSMQYVVYVSWYEFEIVVHTCVWVVTYFVIECTMFVCIECCFRAYV